MEDYTIVKNEYYYKKLNAFKDIREVAQSREIKPLKDYEHHEPRGESKQKREIIDKSKKKPESDDDAGKDSRKNLNCPLDFTMLDTLNLEGVKIDFCPDCYGIWLNFTELERLLNKTLDKSKIFQEKLMQENPVRKPDNFPFCPHCKVKLIKHKHYNADIISEICPVCGGIWLDSGEFAVLYLEKKHEESARDILAQVMGKHVDITA